MKRVRLIFSECEHGGDLEIYERDVIESGGKIVSSYVDTSAEEGVVTAEVDNTFKEKFMETEAYDFCVNL
jgi:hypothetical protein